MCWRAGFIGHAYSSASATPLRVTSQASVWVFARTSPTVVQSSSMAGHFSRSMVSGRKSLSSVTYSRTGPMPRGMPPVGKISCIRVSAKAKYSGHFQESRSMLSRTGSEGSTMASSLAEASSPTCGRVISGAEAGQADPCGRIAVEPQLLQGPASESIVSQRSAGRLGGPGRLPASVVRHSARASGPTLCRCPSYCRTAHRCDGSVGSPDEAETFRLRLPCHLHCLRSERLCDVRRAVPMRREQTTRTR
jgi:hypothetical protein